MGTSIFGSLAQALASKNQGEAEGQRLTDQLRLQVAQTQEQQQVAAQQRAQQEQYRQAQIAGLQAQEAERRQKIAQEQQQVSARIAALKQNPKYASLADDALTGIASDPTSFREAIGLATPHNPIMGSPEWQQAVDYQARTNAKYRPAPDHSAQNDARAIRNATGLQTRYQADPIVKNASQVAQMYQTLQSAASQNSPQADMSMIFAYMKMLDPGSTVREGEYANAQNTTGAVGKIANLYNKAIKGNFLTPGQRQGFIKQAGAIAKGQRELLQRTNKRYGSIAQRHGVDPQDVIFDPFEEAGIDGGGASNPFGDLVPGSSP